MMVQRNIKKCVARTCLALILIMELSCASIEIFQENMEAKEPVRQETFLIVNKELGRKGFQDDYLDAIVTDQLTAQLESNGLVYNRQNPDILIRYTSNQDPREKEVYSNQYPMWGSRMWWDPWVYNPALFNQRTQGASTQSYELLQVIVDFIDPQSDKRIMTLTAVSETTSPKNRKKLVEKSTVKIVETFLTQTK